MYYNKLHSSEVLIMSVTSVRIQADLQEPLEDLASKLHRSKNWLINEAIKEYVDRKILESEKWKETLEAVDSVKNGLVVDGDDVHAWLESWGSADEIKPPK